MSWNIYHQWSIKTRVTVFTLTIFLIGIWLLAFYGSHMLRDDMERLLGEQQFSTASFMAAEINQGLDSRLGALETVAGRVSPDILANTAALQTLLEQSLVFQGLFNGGTFATRVNGTAIADVPLSAGRIGVNYMDADAIGVALTDGKSTIGRPLMGKKLQAPIFGMAVPIRDPQGKVIGALAGVTDLGRSSFLDVVTDSHYGKTGGYLLVAPQDPMIITAANKSRIMEVLPAAGTNPLIDHFIQGREGSAIVVDPLGVEVLASGKSVPVAGWLVSVVLPTAEAFAPIRAMQRRMLLVAIFLTLLAGFLIWWMLRRQFSPLLAAVRTLSTLSDTNQPPQSLPIARQDEIGELIGGFNRLLKTLGQRESLLRQIMDTSSVAIFLVDMEGRVTQANQRMAEMFGCSLQELEGNEYVSLLDPTERELGRQKMLALLSSAIPSVDLERLYWRADHTRFWGHLTGTRFYDASGEERGMVGVIADITARKQAEEKLHLAASVFTHAREGIMITAADGKIIDINDAFTRITGYSRDEVLGRNPRLLNSDRQGKAFYATLWHDLIEQGYWYGEIWNRRKNGEVYAELQTISAVRDAQGHIRQYLTLFSDITLFKENERQLEHAAHYDELTALPNRVLLADRLHQAMSQVQRHGQLLAVAYLDLDGFKAINDSHGHETGDQVLIALAASMKQALREGDTLARLGGDEFIAVLVDLADVAASVPILTRLLVAAAQPLHVGDLVLQVSASVGVTFYPQTENVDADQLLRQADQTMYRAKLDGKNRYHIFDAEQDRSLQSHHESLERIRRALTEHEFILYYQPKVNMHTGTVIGAEGLIRWQHPERGLLPPKAFLPVIEDHPLAVDLGEWAIDAALTQMEFWHDGGLDIPVSVNIGARQLQQVGFVERLRALLAAHPCVRPSDLKLEVLETSALKDLARVSRVIEDCREFGVMFALDDFGTGYSSLTYLKHLPITQIKIDQSFVRNILDDPDDLAIVAGVLGLATAFRCQVIAEGVETVEHGTMLLRLGCELAQGYGIAPPMSAHELPNWAADWRPDTAWVNLPSVSRDD